MTGQDDRRAFRRSAAAIALVAILALGACHKDPADIPGTGNEAVAHGFHPPETRPATPLPGQSQTTPLTAYVGHYPSDAVDGVGFFDRTEVATALNEAVIDPLVRRAIMNGRGPQTPIFRRGTGIASWGCEAHACSDHNWTLFVDPKTKKGIACYHEATMGDRSHWYAGAAPVTKPGGCPSGDGAAASDPALPAADNAAVGAAAGGAGPGGTG